MRAKPYQEGSGVRADTTVGTTGQPRSSGFSPRHAHASWLLAGGADLQVVKERLGHASNATTEKYSAITLPDADTTAIEALTTVRRRTHATG